MNGASDSAARGVLLDDKAFCDIPEVTPAEDQLKTILVEYEGRQIRVLEGRKLTKYWLKRWARTIWVNCGMCGQEGFFDSEKELAPWVCWDCRFQLEQDAFDRGELVGGGHLRRLFEARCIHCGKAMRVTTRVKRVECKKCSRIINSTADPELKRRKLVTAARILRRQYGLKAYEGPLDLIASRLMEPNWWDSSTEIVVTAEILRLGHTVCPQKKLAGHKVDLLVPNSRTVVEIDGDLYHDNAEARRRDLEYDAKALLEGYSVVRVLGSSIDKDVRDALKDAFRWAQRPKHYDLAWERAAWRYGSYEVRRIALRRTMRKMLLRRRRFMHGRHMAYEEVPHH